MAKQITVQLPQMGEGPSRDDPDTLDDRTESFFSKVGSLQEGMDTFATQANEMSTELNAKALAAEQSATLAGQAAAQAGAVAWASGKAYLLADAAVDPVDLFTYRRRAAGSSATRPGLDGANWKNVSVVPDVAGDLVDSGSNATPIAWDAGSIQVPSLTLVGNRAIGAPTNLAPRNYVMFLKQDATGGRNPTFDPVFVFPDDIQPQVDLRPGYVTMFSFISDGTRLRASYMPGYPR